MSLLFIYTTGAGWPVPGVAKFSQNLDLQLLRLWARRVLKTICPTFARLSKKNQLRMFIRRMDIWNWTKIAKFTLYRPP